MTMGTAPPLHAARARASRAPARLARATPASLAVASLLALGACTALAPDQKARRAHARRSTSRPPPGWMAAAPADTLARGPWWTLFGDPVLDQLAPQVAVSNQNVAAAAAAVEESRAAVREQRAAFFPTLSLDAGATRSGTGGHVDDQRRARRSSSGTRFSLGLGASWEPDLWGRIANTVSAATATAQASEADLANATLSAQTTFVIDYLSVREADAEIVTLQTTIAGYERALQITQNRYDAAIAQKSDVLQAQTTLANAQADLAAAAAAARAAVPRDGRAGRPAARHVHAAGRRLERRRPCRRCPWACRPSCCSAGPTSPRPSAASPRPTPTSASRAPRTSRR